jgi:hypothetical protein
MVALLTGPPETASFSRFVLPFGYRLEARKESNLKSDWRFVPEPVPEESPRRHYLTPETAKVLFDRGLWLRLEPATPRANAFARFNLGQGRETVPVELQPPRLVLFEAGESEEGDLLQIGFLLIDAHFPGGTRASLSDLLLLNELFRFWRRPFDEHPTEEPWPYEATLGAAAREAVLSCVGIARDDLYRDRWERLLALPIERKKDEFLQLAPEFFYRDRRAFVWTAAVVAGGAAALGSDPHQSGEWVRLLNIDKPLAAGAPFPPATEFERAWAAERTYRRWQHFGTLYGFNLHSGAMLTGPPEGLPIVRHFGEMYFDQALLLLYLRVGCFRFSRELAEISCRARDERRETDGAAQEIWTEEFRAIRWRFALFANLYQYPLLSNQQQGVEMYTLAREVMDVRTLFEEIQGQIAASHEFVEMKLASEEAESGTRLTVVATVALAGALATGFLGMNVVAEGLAGGEFSRQGFLEWGAFLATLGLSALLLKSVIRHSRRIDRIFDQWARRDQRNRKAGR